MNKRLSFAIMAALVMSSLLYTTNATSSIHHPQLGARCFGNIDGSVAADTQPKMEHEAITIHDEAQFAAQGWSGSGTAGDPYIIENIWISGDTSYGISITNVNVYVLIRNVKVDVSGSLGIYINDAAGVELQGVDVVGSDTGIQVSDGLTLNMTDCTVVDVGEKGLLVSHTLIAAIQDTTFLRCGTAAQFSSTLFLLSHVNVTDCTNGIDAPGAMASSILDSYFDGCENFGARFSSESMTCIIHGNRFYGNSGLYMQSSNAMIISSNDFTSSGIYIGGTTDLHWTHLMANNTVNGKPLGYFYGESSIELNPADYGELIIVSSADVTVANGAIDDTLVGITLRDVTDSSLENTMIGKCGTGIMMIECGRSTIDNCTIYDSGNGIALTQCESISVQNSILRDNNGYGIVINDDTSSCNITENAFVNCLMGLRDDGSNNTWNGNSYDDYDMSGQYVIPGNAGAIDSNPTLYEGSTDYTLLITVGGVIVIAVAAVVAVIIVRRRQ